MRATEFITESADILNDPAVANDANAKLLIKEILATTKFSNSVRLFPDPHREFDSDIIQAKNGWGYYTTKHTYPASRSVTTIITYIDGHRSVATIAFNDFDKFLQTHFIGPIKYYQLINHTSNKYRQKLDYKKTIEYDNPENLYRLRGDQIFLQYLKSTLHKFIEYFSIIDSDSIEKVENDMALFTEKTTRRRILDEIVPKLQTAIFAKLCKIYDWDHTTIAVDNEIEKYMYKAKKLDKLLYYKIVKEELLTLLKNWYK